MRPIRPDDAEALQRFHLAQSPESIYLRFFAPMPRLSDRRPVPLHPRRPRRPGRVRLHRRRRDHRHRPLRPDRRPPTAEVAFNISDPHHGRGLGSVLLEHLAAAARENGVHRFVAEVLPQNRKMIVGLPGRRLRGEARLRRRRHLPRVRHRPDREARWRSWRPASTVPRPARVHALLNPRSVVLVGASRREDTIGHRLLRDIIAADFTGRAARRPPRGGRRARRPRLPSGRRRSPAGRPRNHRGARGRRARRRRGLRRRRRPRARRRLRRLRRDRAGRPGAAAGARAAGPGQRDARRRSELVGRHQRRRRRPAERLAGAASCPGPAGSGCSASPARCRWRVLDEALRRNLGVSTFVSAGNRADVSGNDCMQYWEEDDRTDAVGLYLESIGNPRKFSRIARRLRPDASRSIVVKSGTTGFGAPPGHAVRPSRAPKQAFDALLRQSGCIRVENVHQLFDVAQLVLHQPLPSGRRRRDRREQRGSRRPRRGRVRRPRARRRPRSRRAADDRRPGGVPDGAAGGLRRRARRRGRHSVHAAGRDPCRGGRPGARRGLRRRRASPSSRASSG